jgi:hypothetical protein
VKNATGGALGCELPVPLVEGFGNAHSVALLSRAASRPTIDSGSLLAFAVEVEDHAVAAGAFRAVERVIGAPPAAHPGFRHPAARKPRAPMLTVTLKPSEPSAVFSTDARSRSATKRSELGSRAVDQGHEFLAAVAPDGASPGTQTILEQLRECGKDAVSNLVACRSLISLK